MLINHYVSSHFEKIYFTFIWQSLHVKVIAQQIPKYPISHRRFHSHSYRQVLWLLSSYIINQIEKYKLYKNKPVNGLHLLSKPLKSPWHTTFFLCLCLTLGKSWQFCIQSSNLQLSKGREDEEMQKMLFWFRKKEQFNPSIMHLRTSLKPKKQNRTKQNKTQTCYFHLTPNKQAEFKVVHKTPIKFE